MEEKQNKKTNTRFIFMGDSQCSRISGKDNDYSGWAALLRSSLELCCAGRGDNTDPILVVSCGDLINKCRDEEEWHAFFKEYDSLRNEYEFIMVSPTGTHEPGRSYCDVPGYRERFYLPGNGPLYHEDQFFSFDYGCMHFIVMDSNYMDNEEGKAKKYLGAWLKHDLATHKMPATFVVMHHPMFTTGSSFDDDIRAQSMTKNYLNLMYRYGVDFVLCGHEHVYCRTNESAKLPQIMGVSGDKHFDAKNKEIFAALQENVAVTTIINSDGDTIELTTYDKNGTDIDHCVTKTRPPKQRHCSSCPNYSECKGTGIAEKNELENQAKVFGRSPLLPDSKSGIIVGETTFSDKSLQKLKWNEYAFPMLQRGKLIEKTVYGFKLTDLIGNLNGTDIVSITNEAGIRFRYKGNELERSNIGGLPAVIFLDHSDNEGGFQSNYRLAVGQQYPEQYNGRQWIRHICKIEVYHERY